MSVFIILPHTQGGTKVLWGPTKMPALAGVTTIHTACRQTRFTLQGNIEAWANIFAKVIPFCQAYLGGHGNEYQSTGEVNHKQNTKEQRAG